jgi:nucleoside-diphosphate-sugar epimerase
MDWKNRPVLVTGAAGFIGSHLTRRLVREGARVHLLLRKKGAAWRIADLMEQVTVWEADLSDSASLQQRLSGFPVQFIFHLAGHVDVRRAWDPVEPLIYNNIIGTVNLIMALKDAGFESFLYPGTSEEYGNAAPPLCETLRESPISPYSFSKLSATAFCQMAAKTFDLPITVLRLFPTYGPNQGGSMLIPAAIRELLSGREFRMTHGEQRRDFMYVDDVVEAFLRIAACEKARGEVFNVGTGVPRRVRDVIDIITQQIGKECTVLRGAIPCRKGEGDACCSNNQKLLDVTGWAPAVSLEEGLPITVAWYKKHCAH